MPQCADLMITQCVVHEFQLPAGSGDHPDVAAAAVPGVEVLRSEATRRKVILYVGLTGAESDSGAKGAIAAAVGSATEILSPPPRIAVRIGTSGSA